MFPSPSYTSIDAPSVHWCGAHALAYALYNEQRLAHSDVRVISHLNELLQAPSSRTAIAGLSHEGLLHEALLEVGYTAEQCTPIITDILKIITDFRAHNPASLEELFQGYQQREGCVNAQRLFQSYQLSVKALLGQRASREIMTKLSARWAQLAITPETQQRLINQHTEVIATLREIIVFFDKNRQDGFLQPLSAQELQRQLSPLLYHFYQKLAILPQEQGAIEDHHHMLSAIFGTTELADSFIQSVGSEITVPSARAPEHLIMYQDDLRQRFALLQEAVQNGSAEHIAIPVPNGGGIVNIACEPSQRSVINPNAFKLSAQMTQEMSRLFFKSDLLPEINTHNLFFAHDFDIFGGNTRYVIKSDARHLKLLIRNKDSSTIRQNFTTANGFLPRPAPSGLSYFFGSFSATAQTLLKLAAFLLAMYVFIRICFSSSSKKMNSTSLKSKIPILREAAKASDYTPIEIRGVLAPQKNLKFQKPRPPIPATLSRREQGRTHRKY